VDNSIPAELEERIRHYEEPGNDPGALGSAEWMILVLTGIVLPIACLVLGWFIGWQS
jgi:hypothetical protein